MDQSGILGSLHKYCPITGQYSGHLISIDQSEISIQVTWPVLTNQRSVFRLLDQYWPIRGQYSYSGHVTSIDQSEASITWQWEWRPLWPYPPSWPSHGGSEPDILAYFRNIHVHSIHWLMTHPTLFGSARSSRCSSTLMYVRSFFCPSNSSLSHVVLSAFWEH